MEFTWSSDFGGEEVYLLGSFTTKPILMTKNEDSDFHCSLRLPVGDHFFYFLVDDKERFHPEYPFKSFPEMGRMVNTVEISDEEALTETCEYSIIVRDTQTTELNLTLESSELV